MESAMSAMPKPVVTMVWTRRNSAEVAQAWSYDAFLAGSPFVAMGRAASKVNGLPAAAV